MDKLVNSQEERIKEYLEEQIKVDSALREKYNANAIDKCINYIVEQAKIALNNKNGFIDDPTVFHWAREFFVDGIAERQEAKELMNKVKSPSFKKKLALLNQLEFDFD